MATASSWSHGGERHRFYRAPTRRATHGPLSIIAHRQIHEGQGIPKRKQPRFRVDVVYSHASRYMRGVYIHRVLLTSPWKHGPRLCMMGFCGTHESAPTSSAMSKFSRRFCASLIVYLHIQSYTRAIAIYIQVCFCRSCAVVAPAAQHAHLCCRTALAVLSPVVVLE